MIKNYLYLSGAELASKIVTFAAMAYLARLAGAAGYGYLEFASAVLMCAGLIVDQGFSIYGAREIAKKPAEGNLLTSEIVSLRWLLAAAAYLGVAGFAWLYGGAPIVTRLLLIYGLSLLGMPFLLYWVFQGHNRMGMVALLQAARQFTFAAVVFGFVRSTEQTWIVGIAEASGVACAALLGIWATRRVYGWKLPGRLMMNLRLFREGVPIGLSQIFWTTRMFGATVILGLIARPDEVGHFGAAMRIMVALHSFIYLYFMNLLPGLSLGWQAQNGTFTQLIRKSLWIVGGIGVSSGIPAFLLAPWVMTTVYGKEFAASGAVLQWMLAALFVAGLSFHYRFGLIAANQQKTEMVTAGIGAGTAILAIPLGYFLAGIVGSAAALLFVELLIWLMTWWLSRTRLNTWREANEH